MESRADGLDCANTTVWKSTIFFRKCEHMDLASGGPERRLDYKERVAWSILSLTKSDLYLGSSLWQNHGTRFGGAQVGSSLEPLGKSWWGPQPRPWRWGQSGSGNLGILWETELVEFWPSIRCESCKIQTWDKNEYNFSCQGSLNLSHRDVGDRTSTHASLPASGALFSIQLLVLCRWREHEDLKNMLRHLGV